MAILHTSTIIFLPVLELGTITVDSTRERVSISPVVIAGNGTCPTNEDRHDALQFLRSRNDQVMQIYSSEPNSNCGPGLWRQVFYLNTGSQVQSCPGLVHTFGHLVQDIPTLVLVMLVALVTAVIVAMLHYLLLK